MPTPLPLLLFIFSFLINAPPNHADLILEDGYTVTTVIDGHKLKISPHSVLPRSHLSDLVLLDSSRSAFYTLSFPISQDSVINRLSGDSVPGFSDGEAGSARFNKPKSFAVDNKGNVYVADRNNGAIRKITDSGRTSTIAGGYSKGVGREDGLAQNATFSSDFDLAFVAQECALLISDHGNQLVRRIDLKPDDCASGSKQSAMGAVPIWVLGPGLVLSCLIGVAIGFVVRPHIAPHGGSGPLHWSETWRLCQINLVKPVLMFSFVIRSAIAESRLCALLRRLLQLSLSHLSLMFRINTVGSQTSNNRIVSQIPSKALVSLLDSDVNSSEMETSQLCAELKDLLSFNEPIQSSNSKDSVVSEIREQGQLGGDVSYNGNRRLDTMIEANIMGFAKVAKETPIVLDRSFIETRGLTKRR